MGPSVAVDLTAEGWYGIKISTPDYELNVAVPAPHDLRRVLSDPWVSGSVKVGESAGAPAFWSVGKDGRVSILVGHDDETWDFGVSVPLATFEEILREVEALARTRADA
jgi:hypothetical protein